jgi:hypothetical protein
MDVVSVKTDFVNNTAHSSNNISKTDTPFWRITKKVGYIALGIFSDFADGFIRGVAVQFGILGVIVTAVGAMVPTGLTLLIGSIFVYYISKKIISEKIAATCYERGGVDRNSDLRIIPYAAGVGASVGWLLGSMSPAALA